jgi:ribonuclease HII
MKQAVVALIAKLEGLRNKRIHIIIDGNVKIDLDFPYTNIIKGDSKSKSIASASILAKVTRDRIMSLYDRLYPHYGFLKHKGYGTKMHKTTLSKFGPSIIHRATFCHV